MVTESEVERILDQNFSLTGHWHLNDQGLVDVQGSVSLRRHVPEIPVPFGKVTGIFEARECQLQTLKNSPTHVGLSFKVGGNSLKSLAHAPDMVGTDFEAQDNPVLSKLDFAHTRIHGDLDLMGCNLHSLEGCAQLSPGSGLWIKRNPFLKDLKGMPECYGVFLDYDPHLGLLPLLMVKEINIRNITQHFPNWPEAPHVLKTIMKKYAGKGKSAMLTCALELKQAGFGSNAKW
jgi:hypothetical protein